MRAPWLAIVTCTLATTPLAAGCSEPISPEPLGDYTAWKRIDVTGKAPGHSDSYRVIYVNDLAADPAQSLTLGYPEGSVIVKEIRDNVDGQPGDLRYIAIMRRDRPISAALTDEGGWLFSRAEEPNGPEKLQGFCWGRCHAAAPYNGAWNYYRK
jgi:hypothetical protein